MRSTTRFLLGSLSVTVATAGVLFTAPVARAGVTPGTLMFTVPPVTTQVGTVMSVVVTDMDSSGHVISNFNKQVTLTYAVNLANAPLPQGNTATASNGVATFSLTFSAVGSGLELQASANGVRTSNASDPFDIVDQQVQCPSGSTTCQTETVSSAGTSGSAMASATSNSDVLTATGGGFPKLSCTVLGGVLTFTSTNLSMTITLNLDKNLAQQNQPPGSSHFNICWGSSKQFTTADGTQSKFNSANGEFEGLLPNCAGGGPSPCILSQNKTGSGVEVTTISAPPGGDPHPTF